MPRLNDLKTHHLGIAVQNFYPILEYYQSVGYKSWHATPVRDELQSVDLMMLTKDGDVSIELVSPYSDTSPVHNYIRNEETRIYHTCYEVENFENTINLIKENFKVINVSKPKPAILFDNREVAFYYVKGIGLIELLRAKV